MRSRLSSESPAHCTDPRLLDRFLLDGDNDAFGENLDIEVDNIVIAADNGNYNGDHTGTVYLFRRNASGGWPITETRRLVDSVPGQEVSLGDSIAIDGSYIFVGATQTKVKKTFVGSAYVFELELGSEYCGAETNSLGLPAHLTLTGSAHSSDADVTLSVRDCPPEALGFFLMAPSGDQGLNLTLGEGRLCLGLRGVTRLRPAVPTMHARSLSRNVRRKVLRRLHRPTLSNIRRAARVAPCPMRPEALLTQSPGVPSNRVRPPPRSRRMPPIQRASPDWASVPIYFGHPPTASPLDEHARATSEPASQPKITRPSAVMVPALRTGEATSAVHCCVPSARTA